MQPRTKRQKEILDYISDFIEKRGYKPSYQQIAKHFRLASKAAVAKHIAALEKQGLISRRRENGSFSLELFPTAAITDLVYRVEWLDLPEATRGPDDLSDETLLVPTFLIGLHRPEKLCAFRVPNDSMLDEHICEGDIALIEKRAFARDGDIVVSLINGRRVTLDRIFRDGANVELRPSNKNFETSTIPADKVEIKGIFRGLIRPMI